MKYYLRISFYMILSFGANHLMGQSKVDVNLNYRHEVGGIDTFDRSKFIMIHGSITESDWDGVNFQNNVDLRDSFLNHYDVYLGRNTGGISWYLNQVKEDPNRPGYADSVDLAQKGLNARNNYANKTHLHPYESRINLVVGAQHKPFFPDGTPTGQGWTLANGKATGEYMGRYLNEFHSGNGEIEVPYLEVMNEPLWEFVTTTGAFTPADVFEFHNDVAEEVRKLNPTVKIGGYTTAFPIFEEDHFQRWNDRWKLFMDMSGDNMDFWSIHLYDFNSGTGGPGYNLRRGSNLEATFDMMEHYSQLSFNEVKPFVISEYGGRALDLEPNPWTPYRDWMTMKSFTSMLLSFMDRPDQMLSCIPFIIAKAEWGRTDVPYPWRLMRQAKEADGQTGDYWVFTEMVKFYQLWSDVRGTRIDTRPTNPDIQVDGFANNDKVYIILNNINNTTETINLNLFDNYNNSVQNVKVKQLYLSGNAPVLDENNYPSLSTVDVEGEGAMVIEYTFQNPVLVDESSQEAKYYADQHLTPIIPGAAHVFHLNGIDKEEMGEAILRIGMGREHGKSLTPVVKVNGHEIHVPSEYLGYDQLSRKSWFGVIEVPVPYYYVAENNEITIQFSETGGHISSVSLRMFNTTDQFGRSDSVFVTDLSVTPNVKQLELTDSYQLFAQISPIEATDHAVEWSSSDPSVVSVDSAGNITAMTLGTAEIIVISQDGGFADTCHVEVLASVPPVAVTDIEVSPDTFTLDIGNVGANLLQLTAEIEPIDAADKSVNWFSSDATFATVDSNGLVTAHAVGEVKIYAVTNDGGFSDTSRVIVEDNTPPLDNTVDCSFLPSEIVSDPTQYLIVEYTANKEFDIAIEFKDSNNNWVGEGRVTASPGIGRDTIELKCVSTINWTDPVFPTPGSDYSFFAWIREVGGDWTTNQGGCQKHGVTVTSANSIEPSALASVNMYPNPAKDRLFIDLPNNIRELQASLLDLNGKMLKQVSIDTRHNHMYLSELPKGVYLVRLVSEGEVMVRKLVIE